jgi:hypothetical protein
LKKSKKLLAFALPTIRQAGNRAYLHPQNDLGSIFSKTEPLSLFTLAGFAMRDARNIPP